MSDTTQRRALRNYRSRLNKRRITRFEVQGLQTDRELIRTLARRLAEGGPALYHAQRDPTSTVFNQYPIRAADYLRSEIAAYIEAMLVDGDDRVLPIALRTVSDALLRLQCSRKSN